MNDAEDDVIPISSLFFDDAGPHIVLTGKRAEHYGTTLAPVDAVRVAPRPAPRGTTPAAAAPRYTPARGRELQDLLGTSIAQLGGVSGGSRKTPTSQPTVPVESLLYRGRAALDRALEIRASSREHGESLTSDMIQELLDLIGLAAED
jgi:hypothetical protein